MVGRQLPADDMDLLLLIYFLHISSRLNVKLLLALKIALLPPAPV